MLLKQISFRRISFCLQQRGDLNKGLLLTGPIGCGKTSWMHLIRLLAHPEEQFMVKSTREIAFEFNKDGYETINLYGRRNKRICFDDIGVEQNIKFYGNECNTMAEILLHRYEMQTQYGILTHATTNLSASQLENVYGNRVRSRLRSMFNLVSFPASSQDKRK
jgi:DNA replication protein DnaC